MPRTITAGLDGSLESLAAAHWAAREALRRDLPLRLVHAWQWQPYTHPPLPGTDPQLSWAESVPREAEESLLVAHPGLRITSDRIAEPAVPALLAAAGEAELLVLGSRGLSGVGGFMIGSISMAVVAHSTRPVVLVRADETAEDEHQLDSTGLPSARSPYREVLLGLDTRRPADAVIEFAFDAADRRRTGLRVVHGWNLPPYYGYGSAIDPGLSAELAEQETGAVADLLRPWREKFPGVAVAAHAAVGQAASHLIDASAEAGLVVIGRRDREVPFGPYIGPVAHAVLHHASAPVAVVPHD